MIAITQEYKKAEIGFPILVGLLSILNLYNQILSINNFVNVPSILISLIGLTAIYFYFKNNKTYSLLFRLWASSQILILVMYFPNDTNTMLSERPIWKTSQMFDFCFYFNLGLKNNSNFEIGINFMGLIYAGIAQLIHLGSLIGTKIQLKPLKKDSFLNAYLPSVATIERRLTLSEEKDWLLIKLEPITETDDYKYALIRPKDATKFDLKKKQILSFLLVKDVFTLQDKNNREDFKTGDWVVLQ